MSFELNIFSNFIKNYKKNTKNYGNNFLECEKEVREKYSGRWSKMIKKNINLYSF